jgi:hypothetical protein
VLDARLRKQQKIQSAMPVVTRPALISTVQLAGSPTICAVRTNAQRSGPQKEMQRQPNVRAKVLAGRQDRFA